MKKKTINRREFIQVGAAGAGRRRAGRWPCPGKLGAQAPGKTRVVLIRDKDVLDENGAVNADRPAADAG